MDMVMSLWACLSNPAIWFRHLDPIDPAHQVCRERVESDAVSSCPSRSTRCGRGENNNAAESPGRPAGSSPEPEDRAADLLSPATPLRTEAKVFGGDDMRKVSNTKSVGMMLSVVRYAVSHGAAGQPKCMSVTICTYFAVY